MGWNSWDSYGRTLNEESIKTNAKGMAQHLKRFGWEYVVVDEGWYLANLDARGNAEHARFQIDAFGRYVPVPARFPSAGTDFTFKPLADYSHSPHIIWRRIPTAFPPAESPINRKEPFH